MGSFLERLGCLLKRSTKAIGIVERGGQVTQLRMRTRETNLRFALRQLEQLRRTSDGESLEHHQQEKLAAQGRQAKHAAPQAMIGISRIDIRRRPRLEHRQDVVEQFVQTKLHV